MNLASGQTKAYKPPFGVVQNSPPKPTIEWITNVGKARVSFSRPLLIPTYELYPEFLNENFMRQPCSANNTSENCIKRRQLAKSLEEESKEATEIINRGLVFVDDIQQPILNLMMKPGLESDIDDLEFSWKCIDFKPSYMDFNINYTRYQNVSVHDYSDALEVKFNGYWYFRAADSNEFIEKSVSIISKPVPIQIDPEGASMLAATTELVGSAS